MTTPERTVEELASETARSIRSRLVHKLQIETMNTTGQSIEYRKGLRDMRYLVMDYCSELAEIDLLQTLQAERQKREDAVKAERERIVAILKASYLMTNGYKATDTVRTAMYIENEGFNIAINKRLDFFIEQITQPNNPNV